MCNNLENLYQFIAFPCSILTENKETNFNFAHISIFTGISYLYFHKIFLFLPFLLISSPLQKYFRFFHVQPITGRQGKTCRMNAVTQHLTVQEYEKMPNQVL
jgi:hypothetical protein